MDRTVDVSGWPTRAFQYLLGSSFVFGGLFVASFAVWKVSTAVGVTVPYTDGLLWPVAFAVLWAALTRKWVRHLRRADGDWWGPVPRDQYLGRFAGYGGLARHSWERAIDQLPDDEDD
ncbi:hypothetical protein [Halosimplex salinum]|uniref:hypothetical protein n=1 Tax=Halosimplex salinum TaxID=1710538 RepID=UPI000F46201F|nr:hypothetical protein [Halosimplex salinum]